MIKRAEDGMTKFSRLILAGSLCLLAGCSGGAQALGLGRNAPDEFAVVERPPLALPPEFALRPPQPGAPRPQEVSMPGRASAVLFGSERIARTSGESDAEKAILEAAGASKADPAIRETIDRETTQRAIGSRHLLDEVLWWRDNKAPAATVDPAAETARIKEAREKGEALNNGATPIIEKNKSGWLGL